MTCQTAESWLLNTVNNIQVFCQSTIEQDKARDMEKINEYLKKMKKYHLIKLGQYLDPTFNQNMLKDPARDFIYQKLFVLYESYRNMTPPVTPVVRRHAVPIPIVNTNTPPASRPATPLAPVAPVVRRHAVPISRVNLYAALQQQQEREYETPMRSSVQQPPYQSLGLHLGFRCIEKTDELLKDNTVCNICYGEATLITGCNHAFCNCLMVHIFKYKKRECPCCRCPVSNISFIET